MTLEDAKIHRSFCYSISRVSFRVCGLDNNVSILRRFLVTPTRVTTFAMYVTNCDLRKSINTVEITSHMRLPIHL